eukprot:13389384-Alexandrium_andersonii.AAC.1
MAAPPASGARLALKRTHQRARRASKRNRNGGSSQGAIDTGGEPIENDTAPPVPSARGRDPPR